MDTIATLAWTLLTLGGDTVDARSWQGQPVVVHVWATWCVPCVTELRRIERWWQHQQTLDSARHLRLIVVSPEPLSHVRKFVKRHRLTLPIYVEHSRIPDIYKLRTLPSTFILDDKGNLIRRLEGTQSWDIHAQRPSASTVRLSAGQTLVPPMRKVTFLSTTIRSTAYNRTH